MASKLKSAMVAGVMFQGETVAAAREVGEIAMQRFVHEAKIGPAMYQVHNLVVLVWPDVEGWAYRVVDGVAHSCDGGIYGNLHANCTYRAKDRVAAGIEAVAAAAQRQWQVSVDDDLGWYVAAFGPLATQPEAVRRIDGLLASARFQRRYAAAIAAGADKKTAYDNAGRTESVESCVALCIRELGLVRPEWLSIETVQSASGRV